MGTSALVCASCGTRACFNGQLMCEDAPTAGFVTEDEYARAGIDKDDEYARMLAATEEGQ